MECGDRWLVYTNVDNSKVPNSGIVRQELYVYLLADNLLLTLIWEAAYTYDFPPLCRSMQETRHHVPNIGSGFITKSD